MDDPIVVIQLGQESMRGELALLRNQQESNHRQNRDSIHAIRGDVQEVKDDVSILKNDMTEIKVASAKTNGYIVGAGAVTGAVVTVLSKLIEHLWK